MKWIDCESDRLVVCHTNLFCWSETTDGRTFSLVLFDHPQQVFIFFSVWSLFGNTLFMVLFADVFFRICFDKVGGDVINACSVEHQNSHFDFVLYTSRALT